MPQPKGDKAAPAQCYSEGLGITFPKVKQGLACDVLVIGSGVTGGATALALARAGRDVVLIDEGQPGAGGSGRAFGQVVAFGKHSEAWYRKTYGEDGGQQIIDWLATGPDRVFELIDAYGIKCAARRSGLFFAAHHPRAEHGLRTRAAYWASRGHDVRITEPEETRELTGSPFYHLSLWDKRAGSINPLAYSRGLAEAAISEGARVYGDTRATRLDKDGTGWRIEVQNGTIRARSVALCTNAYSGNLWPKLKRSVVPVRSYQLVSKPLSGNIQKTLLPGGQSITDTRRTFSAVRVFDDGRLHLSVKGPSRHPMGEPDLASANQRIADLFPQLEHVEWEQSWTGWVAVNIQQEPRLSKLDTDLYAVAGYSGRGLAYGTLVGQELAKRIQDPDMTDTPFPARPLIPLPGHWLAPRVVEQVLRYYSYLDDRELRVLRAQSRQQKETGHDSNTLV